MVFMKKILLLLTTTIFLMSQDINLNKSKVYWLDLVHNKKYDTLDKELNNLQKRYEQNPEDEKLLRYAICSFQNSDPDLEDEIKGWIEHNPDSIYAHLALGEYFLNLGWLSRGNRFIKYTRREQIENMIKYFKIAFEDYDWVLMHNKKVSLAYAREIFMVQNYNYAKKIFETGLKNNPLSLNIREAFAYKNLSKWTEYSISKDKTNYKIIQDLIEKTKPLYNKNSKLKDFEGYLDYAKSDDYILQEKYDKALKAINSAIKKSPTYLNFNQRGLIYWHLGQKDKALKDFTKSLELFPNETSLYVNRGKLYMSLNKNNLALNDFNKALKLDMLNPQALYFKASIEYSQGKKDIAIIDFLDSLKYDKYNYSTYEYLSYYKYYNEKNYKNALFYANKAIEFGSKDSGVFYIKTASEWQLHNCEFVKSAYKYKDICQKEGNSCDSKNLNWAIKSAEFAKSRGICK